LTCALAARAEYSRGVVLLEVRDLLKRYQLGKAEPIRAIDGLALSIDAGEFVALYGPSGSGKSTLIDLLAAAQQPDGGTIRINGRDLAAMTERERDDYRLETIGVIGAPENLTEGAQAIEEASLRLCLTNTRNAASGIMGLMDRLGLGERLHHRTEELSMGERQRVMIAMALSTRPALVLADEPTGNLDTENSEKVLELLREICDEREVALLLATHDPQAARFAGQTHELRDGRLQAYRPGHVLVPAVKALEPG
jgi:putative ABC transport system ATP-binding protein